jgi:tripeptide aminopeptidase
MADDIAVLLDRVDEYRCTIQELMELVLTNLVMIAEIPAPTFEEHRRMEFLLERFNEFHLQNCSTDEVGNALGILPGRVGDRTILVVAHMDTAFQPSEDHSVSILPDYAAGLGIGDNSLGVAAVATLPLILEQLGLQLDANLVLMGSARSLGRGDIEGIRFFLNNKDMHIDAGICVEGVKLGRLSYSSIGMLRGEIQYRVPEFYDWTRFGASGAIVNINEIINRILEIPLPRRPRTAVVFNSIESAPSFSMIPHLATLQLEIRSDSGRMVGELGKKISDIASEVESRTGGDVTFEVLSRREPGGLDFSHPFAEMARQILNRLGVVYRISPSTSELSAFIDRGIPAVTVGLTDGTNINEDNEKVEIDRLTDGLAQLVTLIAAADKGCCHEY